ncbi:unnamed protein product, partial [Staurois parvus]
MASSDVTAHWERLIMCIRSCSSISFPAGGRPTSSRAFLPCLPSLAPPISFIRARLISWMGDIPASSSLFLPSLTV